MDTTKKIMFLGGSITVGGVASSYERSWAKLTYEKLARELFGGNCEMRNASLSGTGSFFAAVRLSQHVLTYKPDMVFIEFAVNDLGDAREDADLVVSSLDSIVQRLIEANPKVVIVFVYTSLSGQNAAETHGIVAKHYNIPEIDLKTPLEKIVSSGGKSWTDFMPDGVHPNDEGHRLYAEIVTKAVLGEKERFLTPTRLRASVASCFFYKPRIIEVSEATEQSGFELVPGDDAEHLKHLPELVVRKALRSEKAGAFIKTEFEGTHLGIYYRIGGKMGCADVIIDGEFAGKLDCFYKYADPESAGEYCCFWRKNRLTEGKHTVRLRVRSDKNENSAGNQVIIAGFLVG